MGNRKELIKAVYQLDKAKAPKKSKDIITDPMGQWKYPGQPTRIPGSDITMQGVNYPVMAVASTGQKQMMLPGAEYTFPGADYVDEFPQMKKGGGLKRGTTKSLSGTNKLMRKNPLFKNYKHKLFDPNSKHFQNGGVRKFDEGGDTESTTAPSKPSISPKEQYQNIIKNNYKTYLQSVNNVTPYTKATREGEMNCIHGVCTVIEGSGAKKFGSEYIGNMTFNDARKKEGYYEVDPKSEGFEIGDIVQYARTKANAASAGRFKPGSSLTPVNKDDLIPQHAKVILDKYVDENNITRYVVGHNEGTDKFLISKDDDGNDIKEETLFKHYLDGYNTYDGLIVNRYDPEAVEKREKERRTKQDIIFGKNSYANMYNEKPEIVLKQETFDDKLNKKVVESSGKRKELLDYYKNNYNKLGKTANMPPSVLNKLFHNQIGIAEQESKLGEDLGMKNIVPENLLPTARKLKEATSSNDDWIKDYWQKNANNVKTQYKSIDDFKKHLSSNSKLSKEAKNYLFYNSPKSKGVFQQKELSERGKLLGSNFDTKENEFLSSMYLAIDNYGILKNKYPDLSEDELVDLTTLMHNAPGKALTKEYVDYYLKNNDIDYVNKVKDQRGIMEVPEKKSLSKLIQNTNDNKNKLTDQEADKLRKFINTKLPAKQDGGEYIELELTDDEIEEYRKGGFIVEDISVPSLNQRQEGGAGNKNKPLSFEQRVDKSLGYPKKRAVEDAEVQPWYNPNTKKFEKEEPVDNVRHASAGRYTAEAISNKLSDIPFIPKGVANTVGYLGANALGIGHELSLLPEDERWSDPASGNIVQRARTIGRESLEDIYNNAIGANVGAFSGMSSNAKRDYIRKLSEENKIPDGFGEVDPFKKGLTNKYSNKKAYGGYMQEGGENKEVPINAANPYLILDEGEFFKVRPLDAQLEYDRANQTFENRIPQSGMIEQSDIDPADVLSLGAGLAKSFGKGIGKSLLKSGAKNLVTKSITPIGYDPFTIAAAPLELLTPKALKFKPKTYATKNRYDAWKLYNGLEPEFNTFSKNLDGTLAINDFRLAKHKLQNIIDNPKKSFGTTDIENEFNFAGVHGNGWITKGVDEEGKKFIDFTDTWDLQPLKNVKGLPDKLKEFEVSSLTGGKPFDLKNRIYYDDAGNFFDHKGTKLVEEVQHFPKGIVKQNEAVDEIMLSTPNVVGTKQTDVLKDWNKASNQKFFKGAAAGIGSIFGGIKYHLNKLKEKSKKDLDKKAYGGYMQEGGVEKPAYEIQLPELTITPEEEWQQQEREYIENNPKSKDIDKYLTPFARGLGNTETNYPERLDEEYAKKIDQHIAQQTFKNNPIKKGESRGEYLDRLVSRIDKKGNKYTSEDLNAILHSNLGESDATQENLYNTTKTGFKALTESNIADTYNRILKDKSLSASEKEEMLRSYMSNPTLSKVGEAAGILSPLSIPYNATVGNLYSQQQGEKGYNWKKALAGQSPKYQNALLSTFADPLELAGVGLIDDFGRLGKLGLKNVGKKLDISEVPEQISNFSDVASLINSAPTPWSMQEMPGLHLKSTMLNNPKGLHTQISKDGTINTENALKFIKNNEGEEKYNLIRQAFGETLPKKMNYNDFRKTVQDQLIPLERQFATHSSEYGINKLGYQPKIQGTSFERFQTLMNTPLSDLKKSRLLENKTLILGNKNKFGSGSSAHGNPDETLGHIHFLRDSETPDILTVTQIQSDAFQGTHRIMPKTFDKERQLKSLSYMEELAAKQEELAKTAKQIDANTWQLSDGSLVDKSVLEQMGRGQSKINAMKKAEIENFSQKQLLDKNHQERYLQELVNYAGERGDVNKLRLPTSETAAKVQGYNKIKLTGDNTPGFADLQEKISIAVRQGNQQEVDKLMKIHDEILKTPYMKYSNEHQTILKKYAEQPKTIKKLFGEEPKVVTDSKGNTWYEFDIPENFKGTKGEIKAFQEGGIKTNLRIVDEEEPTLSDEEFFNQPTEDEISDKPARSIYISDPRKIRATTGKKIRPTVDLKSGEYDADAIEKLAEYAVLRGINPYRAIAQALAESTLGTKTPDNVGHTRYGKTKNMYTNMMNAIIEGDSLAKTLGKNKPEEIIQGYNRYGKLTPDTEKDYHGGKVTGFYGVPFPKETGYLDMNKTPLYGIEVLDLQKNVLEPNEKIRSIVQPQLHPRPPKPAIQYFHKNRPEFSKGGVVAKLSQKEIDDYIKQGYIVEEE